MHTTLLYHLRILGRLVVTMFLLCTITAQAATYQCQTPPVTEAFLREIDGRITKLRDALQETGCVDRTRVTLFGLDFYPDPVPEGEENPQLTGQVFATGYRYLAQSMATAYDEGFGLKEFFLSIAGTQDSYQLQLDAKLVQDRFNTLRGLMGMTQQACAQDATLEGYSLARYAEVWYFTYRQLYYWLLLGKTRSSLKMNKKFPRVSVITVRSYKILEVSMHSYLLNDWNLRRLGGIPKMFPVSSHPMPQVRRRARPWNWVRISLPVTSFIRPNMQTVCKARVPRQSLVVSVSMGKSTV